MHVRLLQRFAKWFASAAGVWQTFGALAGWVTLEYTHVVHDNNMFELMAWLTIYSGFTQNVLAYVSTLSGNKLDRVLEYLTTINDKDLAIDQSNTVLLDRVLSEIQSLKGETMAGNDDINWTTVTVANPTAAYTATAQDYYIFCDTTTVGAQTITLPAASAALNGREYVVMKTTTAAGAVTVKTAGGTINGAAAGTGIATLVTAAFGSLRCVCDGTNWHANLAP